MSMFFMCLGLSGSTTLVYAQQEQSLTTENSITWVPIQFRQDSGTRPFIQGQLNGKPLLMMVHSNASMYLMTTHGNAAGMGVTELKRKDDYGIATPGHVSELGRAEANLASLKIGSSEVKDVHLLVFEIPQDPPTDGMLGSLWLHDQRVIVDFDKYRVGLPKNLEAARVEDKRLVSAGYIAHRMLWHKETQSWTVNAVVDGHIAILSVSTVSDNIIDTQFAERVGLALGPVIQQESGPRGALVDTYISKNVLLLSVDGQKTSPILPKAFNRDAYRSNAASIKQQDDGSLGADFMLANQAIIDFGTDMLLLRPQQVF